MKPANYAPVYCALYPEFAEISRKHGYAMAIHGSLARDLDLVCIPWVDEPSGPQDVVDEITTRFHIRVVGGPPTVREHGRLVYTISVGHGYCALDLSFVPTTASALNLLTALKGVVAVADRKTDEFDAARAAIAKAEGK